jgi:hypothetical protein
MEDKMRRLSTLALALALLVGTAWAQVPTPKQSQAFVTWADDLTATSYTYCAMTGQYGNPFGESRLGTAAIKTTGSSTSVTEVTAGTNPFTNLAVGDMLIVRRSATSASITDRVSIVTRTDAANVVVSSAVNWSGQQFRWLKKSCGTAVTDGWFGVGVFNTVESQLEWVTKAATSLEMQTECAIGAGLPVPVWTTSATAAGQWSHVITAGVYDRCRVGLKLTTDTGVQVVNAHISVKW